MSLQINSQITITINPGIESLSGDLLNVKTESYFTTTLNPLYSSVDDVRRLGGGYIAEVNDDIINQVILKYSTASDYMAKCSIEKQATPYWQQNRHYWVTLSSTLNVIFNTEAYIATGQGKLFKQLGDFSVSKGELQRGQDAGVHKFIKWLECEIYKYEYAVRNCADPLTNCLGLSDTSAANRDYQPITPGLTNRGVLDLNNPAIGRRWITSNRVYPSGDKKIIFNGKKYGTNNPYAKNISINQVEGITSVYPKKSADNT